MKYIKEYKIFESNSVTLSDEAKECFLPIVDMLYDKVKIKPLYKNKSELSNNLIKICIDFNDISNQDIIIEEISEAILHCKGYNLDMLIGSVFYSSYKITDSIVSRKLEHFNNSKNFENFMKKNSQVIRSVEIIFRKNYEMD